MSLYEIIASGGIINIVLILISILNTAYFIFVFTNILKIQKELNKKTFSQKQILTSEFENWVSKYFFEFDIKIIWMKNLAGTATMLGLLGTVLGIFQAFQKMNNSHQINLEIFAGGISLALSTTIIGLVVAIFSILGSQLLKTKLYKLELNIHEYVYEKKTNSI